MSKNSNPLLLIAMIWLVGGVISREVLSRAVDMSLAISFLAEYINRQFKPTPIQKIWLLRFRNFSLAAAAVFLIFRIYYTFIA